MGRISGIRNTVGPELNSITCTSMISGSKGDTRKSANMQGELLRDYQHPGPGVIVYGCQGRDCHCPCKEELYLKNLYYTGVLEGTLRMTENHRFLISAIRHAPPCDFLPSGLSSRSIGCICDFPGHGCCHTGRADLAESPCLPALQRGRWHHLGCRWCGEGGCCRTADCGHPCCEQLDLETLYSSENF